MFSALSWCLMTSLKGYSEYCENWIHLQWQDACLVVAGVAAVWRRQCCGKPQHRLTNGHGNHQPWQWFVSATCHGKVETGFRDNPIQIVFINNKFLIKFNPLFLQKSQKRYTKLQSSESTVGLKILLKTENKIENIDFRLWLMPTLQTPLNTENV